jgi:hypothetical protein
VGLTEHGAAMNKTFWRFGTTEVHELPDNLLTGRTEAAGEFFLLSPVAGPELAKTSTQQLAQ